MKSEELRSQRLTMPATGSKSFWKKTLKELNVKSRRKLGKSSRQERDLSYAQKSWEKEVLRNWLKKNPERRKDFENPSGIPLKRIYTPSDIASQDCR